MKKLFKLICLALFITCFNIKDVNAAGFGTSLVPNTRYVNQNGTFTVTINVTNANNLWGFRAPINYDHNKLDLIGNTGLNGFGITIGTSFVADSAQGHNGNFSVATLSFKTKNMTPGQSTTISLGTGEGSDGVTTFAGSPSNTTISIAVPKDGNNYLKSLNTSVGNIGFNKNKNYYKLTVNNNVSSVNITGAVESSKSKVYGLGTKQLNVYNNVFPITVTAENGSKRTYTIEILRKDDKGNTKILSKENTLNDLKIDGYNIPFNKDINEYTVLLKDQEKLNIRVSGPQTATVTIDEIKQYKKGNNVITIHVVAENGEEKLYTINAINLDEPVEEEKPIIKDDKDNKENKHNHYIFYTIIGIEAMIILLLLIIIVKLKKHLNKESTNIKEELEINEPKQDIK